MRRTQYLTHRTTFKWFFFLFYTITLEALVSFFHAWCCWSFLYDTKEYLACTLEETAKKQVFFKTGIILLYRGKKPNLFALLWRGRKCNAHLKCKTTKAYVYMPSYKYPAIYIWLEITRNKTKLWLYCICSSTLVWGLIMSLSVDSPSPKLSKNPGQFWFLLTILISKESRKMCFTGAPKTSWSRCTQHSRTQLISVLHGLN